MSIRKLYGIIDYVDEKKIRIGGHTETQDKLNRMVLPGERHPLTDNNKFWVTHNNKVDPGLVGSRVIVWVGVKKYAFASNWDHNKGDLVRGWKLYLKKIEINI